MMKLYSVIFDFYHNEWVIFNLFLITIIFFFKLNQSPMFFLINVPVDICTGTFVVVRRLSQSDICTRLTFVSPTFVQSNLCTVQRMWVRRLYHKYAFLNFAEKYHPWNFILILFKQFKKKLK